MTKPVKPWTRKSVKQIADCRVLTVNETISVSPDSEEEHNFYVFETADWVNVVPVTAGNELVCIADLLVAGEIDHALVTATLWRMLYFLKR